MVPNPEFCTEHVGFSLLSITCPFCSSLLFRLFVLGFYFGTIVACFQGLLLALCSRINTGCQRLNQGEAILRQTPLLACTVYCLSDLCHANPTPEFFSCLKKLTRAGTIAQLVGLFPLTWPTWALSSASYMIP